MLKKGLLLVAASAVSISAFAGGLETAPVVSDPSHVYVGGQVGYAAHYKSATRAINKEQGAFAARLYVGYMFTKSLGLEYGMGTFGSVSYPNGLKVDTRVGADLDVVGQLDVAQDMYVFAKAGMAHVESYVPSNNSEGWEWMPRAELGLGYELSSDLDLTASYAHYFDLHRSSAYSPQFGVAAVGVQYNF